MTPVQRRRLFKLARFLTALPPKRFNFRTWVGGNWRGAPDLSCGTTACALGWACAIPEFRKLGASIQRGPHCRKGVLAWKGQQHDGMVSRNLFGLNSEEHDLLFLPRNSSFHDSGRLPQSASAKRVAEHIRAFLKNKAAEARTRPRRRVDDQG